MDDEIFILGRSLHYLILILSIFYYKKYKTNSFYQFFIIHFIVIVVVDILASTVFIINNLTLYNVYTFFEFNSFVLIYYHLIKDKIRLKILKTLFVGFNTIYLISFWLDFYILYTIPLEGVVNSVIVILFFIELLNSERILNYKKLLSFWISVGFLVFYLTTVPFWSLYYSSIFETRAMFPIIYYLGTAYQLIFIYALITCKKTENLY